jgi:hypothetical protein
MGANSPEQVMSTQSITDAYNDTVSTGRINVGNNDQIVVLVKTTQGSLTSLTLLPRVYQEDDAYDMVSPDADGAFVLDEKVHTFGSTSIAFILNTKGLKEIDLRFKGNIASGTIVSVHISREGSATRTPPLSA